jgi:hypothetical protein
VLAIDRALEGKVFFTESKEGKPLIGTRLNVTILNFAAQWFGHEADNIDIAVMPLGPIFHKLKEGHKAPFYRTITPDIIPIDSKLDELDVLEEIVFIGYPNGIFDTANLLPIVRRGITATPLQTNYCGEPIFLVDASVFPGSSGSPVFICNTNGYSSKTGFTVGSRILFLGVIGSVYFRPEYGEIKSVPIPTEHKSVVQTNQMIDLGAAYKAHTVVETIEGFMRSKSVLPDGSDT